MTPPPNAGHRHRDPRQFFYEDFADDFDSVVNDYDTRRRLSVVFDQLLTSSMCTDRLLLDAGCGTGWFSARGEASGAHVVSLDLGPRLLRQTATKCNSTLVAGNVCHLPFEDNTFDLVVSSEVIEHTIDPRSAIQELIRVLRPTGMLVVTVPNRLWHPLVVIANALKLRPYHGYENWVHWGALRGWIEAEGVEVEHQIGFHLFPFQSRLLQPVLQFCDARLQWLGRFMVNIAILGRKTEDGQKTV